MSEEQFSELITTLNNSNSNEGNFSAVVTAIGGVVLGALLTYFITEISNKNQFKRDILIHLNNLISDYLFYVKEYSILAKEKIDKGLSKEEKENADNIARELQILQNKVDIIIKNNSFSKPLENVHTDMTNTVRRFNKIFGYYTAFIKEKEIEEDKKIIKELQTEINKYLEVLSHLINQNLK